MDAGQLHESFDARDWAREFLRIQQEGSTALDEEIMVNWFANALIAGYDHAMRQRAAIESQGEQP